MSYCIRKVSNTLLLLVDRKKIKSRWWTYNPKEAMIFKDKKEAEDRASKLKHGRIKVIDYKDALLIRSNIDLQHEEEMERRYPWQYNPHPFDSDALGQD